MKFFKISNILLFLLIIIIFILINNKTQNIERFTNSQNDSNNPNVLIQPCLIEPSDNYLYKKSNSILKSNPNYKNNYKSFNDIDYDNYSNPNKNNIIISDTYSSNIEKNKTYSQSYSNIIENKQYCIRPELDICKYKYTKTKY